VVEVVFVVTTQKKQRKIRNGGSLRVTCRQEWQEPLGPLRSARVRASSRCLCSTLGSMQPSEANRELPKCSCPSKGPGVNSREQNARDRLGLNSDLLEGCHGAGRCSGSGRDSEPGTQQDFSISCIVSRQVLGQSLLAKHRGCDGELFLQELGALTHTRGELDVVPFISWQDSNLFSCFLEDPRPPGCAGVRYAFCADGTAGRASLALPRPVHV